MALSRVRSWFKSRLMRRLAVQWQFAHRIQIRLLQAEGPHQHSGEEGEVEADGNHSKYAHPAHAIHHILNHDGFRLRIRAWAQCNSCNLSNACNFSFGGGLDWCDRGDGRRLNIRPQPLEVANHGDDLAIRLGGYHADLKVHN